MQGYYISMQVITFLAFITFLCPTGTGRKPQQSEMGSHRLRMFVLANKRIWGVRHHLVPDLPNLEMTSNMLTSVGAKS